MGWLRGLIVGGRRRARAKPTPERRNDRNDADDEREPGDITP
jgi:hypothetical protein